MIRFENATTRKTPCYILNVGRVKLVISYETVIAVSYRDERVRRINTWGPTTGRHMKETNVYDWEELGEQAFTERMTSMVLRSISENVQERLAA